MPDPTTHDILELCSVRKHHGDAVALGPGPVSLGFAAGQTTVLLGPSGCGKTTALRLLMGLIEPDPGGGGEVRFHGRPLTRENVRAARVRMGYVVQDGGLFPHLTAIDNVCLMARHLGWTRERLRARTQALAELVHLPAAILSRFPAEISGGQKQRVALMRALMLEPEVLLLDEPLAALDPLVRAELQDELVEIFAALKKTVVLVTHDLAEAAWFAHVLVLMKDGQIVQRGSLEDLLERPATPFVRAFVHAQRRFGPGEHGGRQAPAGEEPAR
jgi:osmoprotectant transport system ATP-binding protein